MANSSVLSFFVVLLFLFSFSFVVAEEEVEERLLYMNEFELENTEFAVTSSRGTNFRNLIEEIYLNYLRDFAKKHKKTIIWGFAYDDSTGEVLRGVNVTATCYHEGESYTETTKTNRKGQYLVQFKRAQGENCFIGDPISIYAEKDGLYGIYEGEVDEFFLFRKKLINWINIPLVPEFGFFVGLLTLVSAVGIFFVVRRE